MGNVCMRMSRKPSKLIEKLNDAKSAHRDLTHINNTDEFCWENLESIELCIKQLEYEVWCEEYEDNQRRNWR